MNELPHAHCALCDEPATLTIRPATAWRGGRISHDVCLRHLMDGLEAMWADHCSWVEVGGTQARPWQTMSGTQSG